MSQRYPFDFDFDIDIDIDTTGKYYIFIVMDGL
jgi:hypothetical protein